jgi:hypothetical protein
MALTAVTGLKITGIRRSFGIATASKPSNFANGSPTYYLQNTLGIGHAVMYTFDLEWTNPNFDPHWTELTITDSGLVNGATTAYAASVMATLPALDTGAYAALSEPLNYLKKIYYGEGSTTVSNTYTHRDAYRDLLFVGGNTVNKFTTLGCQICLEDGDYERTVTIKVAIKDPNPANTKETTITQTISLGSTISDVKGPLYPEIGPNGTVSVRYIDPFVKTESDSASASTQQLGSSTYTPLWTLPHPLYSQYIRADFAASRMSFGKFYEVSQSLTYGKAAQPLFPELNYGNEKFYLRSILYHLKRTGFWSNPLTVSGSSSSGFYYYDLYSRYYPYGSSRYTSNSSSYFGYYQGYHNSSLGIQYAVVSAPLVETTATAVIRTTINQQFTYVVKSTSGGSVSAAAAGATSFSLGTIPAGLTATIDSTGTITATMTAVGTYTLQVYATNAVGTSTGSVKFTASAFVGNDTSIEISPSEPINLALSASAAATFTLVSTSSNVPAGELTIVNGRLNGFLRFVGTYSATIRATMNGTSPAVTDDFVVTISVKSLTQPLSVRATNVRRVLSTDKTTASYYGVVEWFNGEPKNHTVRVDRIDSETNSTISTSFPKGSQKTSSILLGAWNAATELDSKSFEIKVYVVGDYSTSEAGIGSYVVSKSQSGTLTGQLAYDDVGNINLPSFDLAQVSGEFDSTVGLVSFTADSLTTPQISSTAPPPSTWKIFEKIDAGVTSIPKSSLQFTTLQQVYGLKDGGRYFAEARYSLAGALSVITESTGKKIWSAAANSQTASVGFEYYYRGLQAPAITSPLSVFADVGTTFQYQIVALGATSFGATLTNLPEFYVDTASGMIEGIFTSEGTQVIPITATNRKGTSSQSLTITVRDFYSDPKSIRAIVNRYIREKLEASKASTWTIVSGAPAGVSIITDSTGTPYLVGSVAATGSYSIVLRATQKNYTPTRYVDVTYTLSVLSTDFLDPSEMPTLIVTPSNLKAYSSDKPLLIGDKVKLAFKSDPAPAEWAADGLPPGLKINRETGEITGTVTTAGTYLTQVTATAIGRAPSLPLIVDFIVDPTNAAKIQEKGAGSAIARFPWLAAKWDLIDLQINARTRLVQSSLMVESLIMKIGDDLRFGVFFIDGDEQSFAIEPTRIRLTIRPINNVDDPLIFESVDSPIVVTEEDTPYYELASVRGVDSSTESMSVVEDWVIAQQAAGSTSSVVKVAAPLACVGEIEWVKDGKSYSSATFPVSLDLDVNR